VGYSPIPQDSLMICADQRWIGKHGIGQFARHVLAGLDYLPVPLVTRPSAPLDSWRLTRALANLTCNDLFFSPGYNSPLFCPSRFVFSVHDLSHIYCPENSSPAIRVYYATVLKRACHRAVGILTVSEFTRMQIIEWSGVPPEKVFNVRSGVDPEYHPEVDPYDLPFPYLLCVSNRKRHKNEFRVVEAFAKTGLAADMRLVFTGEPTAELADHIARCHVTHAVHFVGIVPDAEFPSLHHSAVALVFPSLYEGFGLAPLEAMACGTPVVTSNTTGLREVAGDAALLVDPRSVEQIVEAIKRIVCDTSLRQQLRLRGLDRAAQFPWATTAAMAHEVLIREHDSQADAK
jgi:glycosyltransferase involved in cell wall biosynthesis